MAVGEYRWWRFAASQFRFFFRCIGGWAPVGLLVIGGIAAAIYVNRGGNLGDLPDVIRQGFSKRD
jgi:hypothetical protein